MQPQPTREPSTGERKVVVLTNGSQIELELKSPHELNSPNLAVFLHPWSWLGGQMDDPVLQSLVPVFEQHEYHILRYNSRGVGRSRGWASLSGFTEGKDLESVVQWALQTLPDIRSVVILGYSHGSLIASLASLHPLLQSSVKISHILLSYPLGARPFLTLFNSRTYTTKLQELIKNPSSNVLVIYGDQDEFTGSSAYEEMGKQLQDYGNSVKVTRIEGASHFWRGRANEALQQEVYQWLVELGQQ